MSCAKEDQITKCLEMYHQYLVDLLLNRMHFGMLLPPKKYLTIMMEAVFKDLCCGYLSVINEIAVKLINHFKKSVYLNTFNNCKIHFSISFNNVYLYLENVLYVM